MQEQPENQLVPTPGPQQRGISVGALLTFSIIVLLVAGGTIAYVVISSRSENKRLREDFQRALDDRQRSNLRALEAQTARQNQDVNKEKADQASRLAVAKQNQDAFAIRAGAVTNSLDQLLVQIPAFQSQLSRLLSGDDGRKVSIFPDLVSTARAFFQKEARDLPTRDEAAQKLEAVRRLLTQISESAGTAFEPTPQMAESLDDTKTWLNTATNRLAAAKSIADTLLREATQIKVTPQNAPPLPPTLDEAIKALNAKEWADRQASEAQKLKIAQDTAASTTVDVRTNQIVQTAIANSNAVQQALQIELDKKQAKLDADKLRAEAQSAEVKNALSPFITPGMWAVNSAFANRQIAGKTPRPMSRSALSQAGCLNESSHGLQALSMAASSRFDTMRPRWQRLDKKGLQDSGRLEQARKAQEYLIRLGDTLVELGMLDP